MKWSNYIESKPTVCHGQPCFKNTRIMVHLVLQLLQAGETPEYITKNAYPKLTKKHIQAALQYATEMISSAEFIPFPGRS